MAGSASRQQAAPVRHASESHDAPVLFSAQTKAMALAAADRGRSPTGGYPAGAHPAAVGTVRPWEVAECVFAHCGHRSGRDGRLNVAGQLPVDGSVSLRDLTDAGDLRVSQVDWDGALGGGGRSAHG